MVKNVRLNEESNEYNWVKLYNELTSGFAEYVYNEFGKNYFPDGIKTHIKYEEYYEMPCLIIRFFKSIKGFVDIEEWVNSLFRSYKGFTIPVYYSLYYFDDIEVIIRFSDRP